MATEIVLPARLSALPAMAAFIAETSERAGVPADLRYKLTLLVEEPFTNTVVHGHRGERDEPVRVGMETEPGWIALTYEDTGPPHNPFEAVQRPDDAMDVDDRPVGGLGVLLVLTLARNVEYRRAEGKNHIRLVVNTPA
jgi:anti-sigma regulatory factor (Ser/Thr protein kinase)